MKSLSTLDPQLSTFRHRGERGAPKPTLGGKLLMPVDAARWKSVAGHTLFPGQTRGAQPGARQRPYPLRTPRRKDTLKSVLLAKV
ncbi:MAG: hypothetical protein J6C44_04160 [Muribaculaceae bacterium]|nr:hypothetical protein [Muribaculaceae bacterium]